MDSCPDRFRPPKGPGKRAFLMPELLKAVPKQDKPKKGKRFLIEVNGYLVAEYS